MRDLEHLRNRIGKDFTTGITLTGIGKKWIYTYSRWVNEKGISDGYLRISVSDYIKNDDFDFHCVIPSRVPLSCRL